MLTTIVLADDHKVVRQGIRLLLEAEPDLRLVGEAGDGLDAVDLVERLQPDVLVLDLMMPGLGGVDVARQVVKRSPRTRILILSMHDDDAYVRQSLSAGAVGYVLKDCSADELVQAIHAVAAGQRYLSPVLAERMEQLSIESGPTQLVDLYDALTDREREVLRLTAEGQTSAQVATRLFISPRTAETHRANLMRKLGVKSQSELIRYVMRRDSTLAIDL